MDLPACVPLSPLSEEKENSLTTGATVAGGAGATWDGREEIPVEAIEASGTIRIDGTEALASLTNDSIQRPHRAVLRSLAAFYERRYICEVLGVRDAGGKEYSRRRHESGAREEFSEPHFHQRVQLSFLDSIYCFLFESMARK